MEIKLKLKHYVIGGAIGLASVIGAVPGYLFGAYNSQKSYFQGIEDAGNMIVKRASADNSMSRMRLSPYVFEEDEAVRTGLATKLSENSNLSEGEKQKFREFLKSSSSFSSNDIVSGEKSVQFKQFQDFEDRIGRGLVTLGTSGKIQTEQQTIVGRLRDTIDERYMHENQRD